MAEPMYEWAKDMWLFPRSLTGNGNRQTLQYLKTLIPDLRMLSVASGTQVFDWIVPQEYFIQEAHITDETGRRVVDISDNHLHVVGYSTPINSVVTKDDLESHLFSLPERPDAIPYITSYYREDWGFCLTHYQRQGLSAGPFHVVIKSEKFNGVMDFSDVMFPGKTTDEILFSTYICHPNLANDNISGIVVSAALARYVANIQDRHYTYRFVFVPETIGCLAYLAHTEGGASNLSIMRDRTRAGFVVACCGTEGSFSIIPGRMGGGITELAINAAFGNTTRRCAMFDWSNRGSDERQYCWPGIDLPVASITKAKYGEYREYHTSDDNLEFISQAGLASSFEMYKDIIVSLENNHVFETTTIGEPSFSRRQIPYPGGSYTKVSADLDFLSLCDGKSSLLELFGRLSIRHCCDMSTLIAMANRYEMAGVIRRC